MRIRLHETDENGNEFASFPKGAPSSWNVTKRWIASQGKRFVVDTENNRLTVRTPEGQADVTFKINPTPEGRSRTNFYLTLEG